MKNRLLVLKTILEKETNEQNPITTSEILLRFKKAGYTISRKTLYNDINLLQESGITIAKIGNAYYIKDRKFQFDELRMLSDMVRAARFLSVDNKTVLIQKLTSLINIHEGPSLQKGTYTSITITPTKDIDITLQKLQHSIETEYIIHFHYGVAKNIVNVELNPYALYCKNDQYYLMGFCEETKKMQSYLIAYIYDVYTTRKKSRAINNLPSHNATTKKKPEKVKFLCKKHILYPLLEKFNASGHIKYRENDLIFSHQVLIDQDLITWVLQFGTDIEVLEPAHLRKKLYQFLMQTAQIYNKSLSL